MTENYTPLTLTVNGDPNIAVAYAKQGDKNASGVVVTMVDDSGKKITIPTGLTAKIRVLKPDRRWVEGNATIQSDGTVQATYTDQMLVVAGPCLADITLSENDQRLSSMNFTLMVERAPMGTDEDSYNEFGSLENAVNNATKAATTATAAAESAAEDAADAQELYEYVLNSDVTSLRQELMAGTQGTAGLHLGFYKDSDGDICQVDET